MNHVWLELLKEQSVDVEMCRRSNQGRFSLAEGLNFCALIALQLRELFGKIHSVV